MEEQVDYDPYRNTMEEEDYDVQPKTLQEELNEILEAFYSLVSEEEIQKYQTFVEGIRKQRIAEDAVKAPSTAPDFALMDQDNERVHLKTLLESGPVVITFYRGKWCPHCNATIMRLQTCLQQIRAKGATLVAISPMLPDGTQYMATKRCLQFPVLSDLGNVVARQYKLTFTVPHELRATFMCWGDDIPAHNGDDLWEIPLPATYIINQEQQIVWSFIDNDPGCRAEPADIVAAIPTSCKKTEKRKFPMLHMDKGILGLTRNMDSSKRGTGTGSAGHVGERVRHVFGEKKKAAHEYLASYM